MNGKLELHRRWRTIWAWLMFDMAPKKYHSKTDNQLAGKEKYRPRKNIDIPSFILLHEKFLRFDLLRAVVFQLNLKYIHVNITNLLWVVANNK